jgi:hypothetical protein
MKIISLGGLCTTTQGLEMVGLRQEGCPYDWLYSNQSFIFDTFLNPNNFFDFDDKTQYFTLPYFDDKEQKRLEIRHKNRNAIAVHEFENNHLAAITGVGYVNCVEFVEHMELVKAKYKRRFERLYDNLNCNEPVLLIRTIDDKKPAPEELENDYINIENDNIEYWYNFIQNLETQLNKPFFLLIVTYNKEEYQRFNDFFIQNDPKNIIICFLENNNSLQDLATIFLNVYLYISRKII